MGEVAAVVVADDAGDAVDVAAVVVVAAEKGRECPALLVASKLDVVVVVDREAGEWAVVQGITADAVVAVVVVDGEGDAWAAAAGVDEPMVAVG